MDAATRNSMMNFFNEVASIVPSTGRLTERFFSAPNSNARRHVLRSLCEAIVSCKSFVTVNTNQSSQAIVACVLLDQNASLRNWIEPTDAWYQADRDDMLSQLKTGFPLSDDVRWNRPSGGFFMSIDRAFRSDADEVTECTTKESTLAK
jgi:DNA-binding transcriptional MocR family regulator